MKKKSDKEKLVVRESNQLIESRHPLTLTEMKLFLLMLSEIKFEDKEFQTYRVYIKSFLDNIDSKRTSLWTQSKVITKKFLQRVIELKTDTGFIQTHFISHIEYFDGEGYIEYSFHKSLKPHLLQLKKSFTSMDILNVLSCHSIFSIRIYQLLKSFEGLGKRKIRITDLKTLLMIEKKYTQWNDFKRFVLEKSRRELKKYSDIYFTYETHKKGRRYDSITFHIHKKSQKRFNFDKEESPYLDITEVLKQQKELEEKPPQKYDEWKEVDK